MPTQIYRSQPHLFLRLNMFLSDLSDTLRARSTLGGRGCSGVTALSSLLTVSVRPRGSV